MAKTKRISMTIPLELLKDLDSLSTNLSISRSSLITEILAESIPQLKNIIDQIAPAEISSEGQPQVLQRNPDVVRSYLDSLKAVIDQQKGQFDTEIAEYQLQLKGLGNGH
jgi:predicted DNA-binding protein